MQPEYSSNGLSIEEAIACMIGAFWERWNQGLD